MVSVSMYRWEPGRRLLGLFAVGVPRSCPIPASIEVHSLQSLVDLAPTFLSAAGLPVPLEMQGVDQLAV
jgi:hypothetical protein